MAAINKNVLRIAVVASAVTLVSLASAGEQWGAISIDFLGEGHSMATAYYGVGGGGTKEEAIANAQKFCAENGKHCQSVVSYMACGAYASDEAHGGYGADSTKKAAEDRAVTACAQGDCKILVSDCN
jgi:hypothetical protein